MSKAFTKEHEDEDPQEDELPPSLQGKNYITPDGYKKLQDELKQLKFKDRPEITKIVSWAAGNGDRSENGDYLYGKKKLREIDRRLRFVTKRIQAAEVIDPKLIKSDTVMFGATVTIRNEDDIEKTYQIVGVDELDIENGKISWISPLAKALMRAKVGDVRLFRFPKGEQEIEVVRIVY